MLFLVSLVNVNKKVAPMIILNQKLDYLSIYDEKPKKMSK